jgi:hypothetical protein
MSNNIADVQQEINKRILSQKYIQQKTLKGLRKIEPNIKGALKGVLKNMEGEDLQGILSLEGYNTLEKSVQSHLQQEGGLRGYPGDTLLLFNHENFTIPKSLQEVKNTLEEQPHVLVNVFAGSGSEKSSFVQNPIKGEDWYDPQARLYINMTNPLLTAIYQLARSDKAGMLVANDYQKVLPFLMDKVSLRLKQLISHEVTHAVQYARVLQEPSLLQEYKKDMQEMSESGAMRYRHPTRDMETEAIRREIESEIKEMLKGRVTPARINHIYYPRVLKGTLTGNADKHTKEDVRGVLRAFQGLERDNLLTTRMINEWGAYLKKVSPLFTTEKVPGAGWKPRPTFLDYTLS